MASRVVQINRFDGGEFGDLGAVGALRNQFNGTNLMRYQDGTVGPRPGVKQIAPTGGVAGAVWAFRGLGVQVVNGIVYGQGSNVYGFTFSPLGTVVGLGTVSTTVTTASQLIQYGPGKGELARYLDKIYEITAAAPTVVPLPASPGALVAAPYGIRLIVANSSNTATITATASGGGADYSNRVYYSAAADTTSWPALNFFDVSNIKWPISYIDEVRQRLVIANQGGEWWAESGTPGVNDSLQRQPRGDLAPLQWYHAARTGENVWFFPSGEDFPAQFTGIVVDKLRYRYLRFTGGTGTDWAMTAAPVGEIILAVEDGGSNRGMLFANDAWTYHTFGVTTSKYLSPASVGGMGADLDMPIILCDGGGAAAPKFYTFLATLDRPAKTSDSYAQPGDDSTTPLPVTLNTIAITAKPGADLWAKRITITGFKWNTGSVSTNHLDLVVRSWFRRQVGNQPTSTKDSKVYSWDEATSATTVDKTPFQVTFTVGDQQPGDTVQIRLSAIRGISVEMIEVDCDERG